MGTIVRPDSFTGTRYSLCLVACCVSGTFGWPCIINEDLGFSLWKGYSGRHQSWMQCVLKAPLLLFPPSFFPPSFFPFTPLLADILLNWGKKYTNLTEKYASVVPPPLVYFKNHHKISTNWAYVCTYIVL